MVARIVGLVQSWVNGSTNSSCSSASLKLGLFLCV